MISILFAHEWRGLIRSPLLLLLTGLVLGAGLYGIHYGAHLMEGQHQNIRTIQEREAAALAKALQGFAADTTVLAGRQAFQTVASAPFARPRMTQHAILEPSPLAGLSIGQRDMFAYAVPLSAQSLYLQLFRDEIANPQKLLSGNFDLAFVLVYLFPLLLIALGYNVLSGERELGTYALFRLQPVPVRTLVGVKLLFYFLLVAGLATFLSVLGFWRVEAFAGPEGSKLFSWLAVVLLYCGFWLAAVYWVASWNQSSEFNALLLLSLWLVLLVVLPAGLNMLTALTHPVEHTHLSNIIRRQGIPNGDRGEDSVLQVYYAQHPQYDPKPSKPPVFKVAKAYAAFTEMSDQASGKLVEQYQEQVLARQRALRAWHPVSPAANAQQALNDLARTDVGDFVHFQQALVPFHRQITAFFHPRIFLDQPLLETDYERLPQFKVPPSTASFSVGSSLWPLGMAIVFLGIWGYGNARRRGW